QRLGSESHMVLSPVTGGPTGPAVPRTGPPPAPLSPPPCPGGEEHGARGHAVRAPGAPGGRRPRPARPVPGWAGAAGRLGSILRLHPPGGSHQFVLAKDARG